MKIFRPILSLAFAFLVLFSGSDLMVGIHLCSGQIKSIALFKKADACEKEKKLPPCHRQESIPCCQDETIVHNAQDFNGNVTQTRITPVTIIDVIQPSVILSEIIPSLTVTLPQYHNYDPPLRLYDITVALHVFLI